MSDEQNWHTQRLSALAAPWGWLNLVSRDELPATGTLRVGSATDNDIVLPIGPARLGELSMTGDGTVIFAPADGAGAPQRLVPDAKSPPRFSVGPVLAEITTLNNVNALRVRDAQGEMVGQPPAIPRFPHDPSWRIVARWEALTTPVEIEIDTSKAIGTKALVTRQAVFERDGRQLSLLATHGTDMAPQFVFRDLTARDLTYPAARFLFGEDVDEAGLILDFNHAINPPCSFTDFAVCPLPPAQNILPLRIEAGEQRPASR